MEQMSTEEYRYYSVTSQALRSGARKEQPKSEEEKMLRELWADTLGIDRQQISRNDTWFKHGGDSLLAMKLGAQASERGFRLTMKAAFEHPALSSLARTMTTVPEAKTEIASFQLIQLNSHPAGSQLDSLAGSQEDSRPCSWYSAF